LWPQRRSHFFIATKGGFVFVPALSAAAIDFFISKTLDVDAGQGDQGPIL
jgi:hypothetical protein